MISPVVRKTTIEDTGNDFAYWQARTPQKRLEALESIREEYHQWRYGHQPGFQRVCTVVKRP